MPIDIKKEPRDERYRKLIEYAFNTCTTFIFAMHKDILEYYPEPKLLKQLLPYKVNQLKAAEYTKIQYYYEDAVLYFYNCCESAKEIILQAVNGLYDWRFPEFPEDLTFLDDKGDIWMDTISHENMAGILERNKDEVEFIRHNIGLDFIWIEKLYTEEESNEAVNTLFSLIDKYFILLQSCQASALKAEAVVTANSKYYGFWNMFFHDYNINEHCLAYEIANFSKLLKLDEPIYAYDFQHLLSDLDDTSYLEEALLRNLNCNRKPLTEFLANFKVKYKQNEQTNISLLN